MATQKTYSAVTIAPPPVYRGGPAKPPAPRTFNCTSITVTWSWGSEPASATAIYDLNGAPVTSGWLMTIQGGGHTFYGCCISDVAVVGSGGQRRTLTFSDNRYFLDFDQVFCSFNKLNDKIVGGVRQKRYEHILPNNYNGLIKTYTDEPYTAAEMMNFVLRSVFVKDTWVCNYHADQLNKPVYDVDCMSGKSLKTFLQELSDAQGLVFTLMGGPFSLVWARKGTVDARFPGALQSTVAPLENHPVTGTQLPLSDDRSFGTALSGHPTHIIILGDRNFYQVHDIPMVKDWLPAWEQFYDIVLFREDIYQRGTLTADTTIGNKTFKAGTAFTAIGADKTIDPEQVIARQLALARSLEITVADYATLRNEKLFVDAPKYADYRKFCGKSRLDMPATLYIEQVVFRAFRFPDGFALVNQDGISIPLDSLEIAGKMIARVTHDPITGKMSWNRLQCADGNGYAIIQGYSVGRDMFRTINPERFDLSQWNNAQKVWEHVEFQVDDTGEPNGKLILFNEPIIASDNVVQIIDGFGVFNAAPKKKDGTPGFDTPAVRIAVCFAAERFKYEVGNGNRDSVESVAGLNTELSCGYVTNDDGTIGFNNFEEVPYSDGLTSVQKAEVFAAPLLDLQFIYSLGERKRPIIPNSKGAFVNPTQLNPFIDRVSIQLAPAGCTETISYTCERPRMTYTPERDLDRNTKLLAMLPGQAQLRQQFVTSKLIASALQINPSARKSLANAFKGLFGSTEPLSTINL